jgi:hypothetical protein
MGTFCTVSILTPLGKGVSSVDPFSSHVTVSTGQFACRLIMHVKVAELLMAATKDPLGTSDTREMECITILQATTKDPLGISNTREMECIATRISNTREMEYITTLQVC